MRRSGALLVLAVLLALAMPAFAEPAVTGVRLGIDAQRTRIVIDLSEAIEANAFLLSGPDRLVLDLPKLDWEAPEQATSGAGLVTGYRYGPFDKDTFRLVLDLDGPARIVRKFSLPPGSGYQHRFVVDLAEIDPIAKTLAENEPDSSATFDPQIPAPMRKPRQLTLNVVIDPGHGGNDPGAVGVSGSREKEIVLDVGLKLRDMLRKRGYRVEMTRETDIYHSLKQRVALARDAKADLFISLHADSNSESNLKGASVYTLSDTASDAATAELARKENGSDMIAGISIAAESEEVSSILIELTMRETMNQSGKFARVLLPQLGAVTPLIKNTHRFAGFRVLKAPDVPSVLVELGQLSNKEDEERLTDAKVQARMAEAMVRAVDAFFALDQRAERGQVR